VIKRTAPTLHTHQTYTSNSNLHIKLTNQTNGTIMKTTSLSLFLSFVALSGTKAFVPSGRSFVENVSRSQQPPANNPFFARGGAQERLVKPAARYTFFSEISASLSNGDASASEGGGNIFQNVASAPLTKAILSSTIFVFTDLLIKRLFNANGISFPSSLAGCCFTAAALLASPFHERLYRILNPGAKLMQKFMMIFLVPNLVVLPLCEGSYSALEVSKHNDEIG